MVLRFQVLVCRYLGFILYAEGLLICALRLLEVKGCLTEAVDDGNTIRPGGVIQQYRPWCLSPI